MVLDPLSVLVGAVSVLLARFVVLRWLGRPRQPLVDSAPQRLEWTCEICARHFTTEEQGVEHVLDTHNAPDRETAEDCVVMA